MWAHYANSHRGIALVFRLGADEDEIGASPIRYQKEFPRVAFKPTGIDVFYAFTKGAAWQYEREWRIVETQNARTWKTIPAASFRG